MHLGKAEKREGGSHVIAKVVFHLIKTSKFPQRKDSFLPSPHFQFPFLPFRFSFPFNLPPFLASSLSFFSSFLSLCLPTLLPYLFSVKIFHPPLFISSFLSLLHSSLIPCSFSFCLALLFLLFPLFLFHPVNHPYTSVRTF